MNFYTAFENFIKFFALHNEFKNVLVPKEKNDEIERKIAEDNVKNNLLLQSLKSY